ncbi:dTDP-glucose 4,6-dehydratase [bacterium]|nr:dTDP-glucose 4,6-dehydratase [bacterium]
MRILITGGFGFIGSHLIRHLYRQKKYIIKNIDNLAYSADPSRLNDIEVGARYSFSNVDITNTSEVREIVMSFKPNLIMNLAAESHVDNSIADPKRFIETNIFGTYNLLEAFRIYLNSGISDDKTLKFHQISTDEVYGDLSDAAGSISRPKLFNEQSAYLPSSPYSASKASADHLVNAWARTYNIPVVISTCSNNYGPGQHCEKLIPKVISKALRGEKIPVYGNGLQIRDWLYVEDHVRALLAVAERGCPGETYAIGGLNEQYNIDVVRKTCSILDNLSPQKMKYENLITFVQDRPGHDLHYGIDPKKIQSDLQWRPLMPFDEGLYKTVLSFFNSMRG